MRSNLLAETGASALFIVHQREIAHSWYEKVLFHPLSGFSFKFFDIHTPRYRCIDRFGQ